MTKVHVLSAIVANEVCSDESAEYVSNTRREEWMTLHGHLKKKLLALLHQSRHVKAGLSCVRWCPSWQPIERSLVG